MKYKKVDIEIFQKYFSVNPDAFNLVIRINMNEHVFGRLVAIKMKDPEFGHVAGYGLIPKNFKKRYYAHTDLEYYLCGEYVLKLLLEGDLICQKNHM